MHSSQTDLASLRASPSWEALNAALSRRAKPPLDSLLTSLGNHSCPASPLLTTVINILNAHRWLAAGYTPALCIGHSVGEVAAAYVAGRLSLEGAIDVATALGTAGAEREGRMAYTSMRETDLQAWRDDELCIGAVNGVVPDGNEASSGSMEVVCAVPMLVLRVESAMRDTRMWVVSPRARCSRSALFSPRCAREAHSTLSAATESESCQPFWPSLFRNEARGCST